MSLYFFFTKIAKQHRKSISIKTSLSMTKIFVHASTSSCTLRCWKYVKQNIVSYSVRKNREKEEENDRKDGLKGKGARTRHARPLWNYRNGEWRERFAEMSARSVASYTDVCTCVVSSFNLRKGGKSASSYDNLLATFVRSCWTTETVLRRYISSTLRPCF